MKLEVKVPSVGESVTEAQIDTWEKAQGDLVQKGEVLVILETDKASMEIPAESDGALTILKQKGETVSVGDVLATIDTSQKVISKSTPSPTPSPTPKDEFTSLQKATPTFENDSSSLKLSPSVRHLIEKHNLDPQSMASTGKDGRLTKKDILEALNQPESLESETLKPLESIPQKSSSKGQRREPMSLMRKRTAERLVESQHTTATLSTFNEVDMSRVIELRKKHQDSFIKKYGIKLGFMSFFVQSVVSALKQYPKINAFIDGTDIVYNDSFNIGVAIGTERGLVVPVLFNSESLNLGQIEKQILTYKEKASNKKLTPDDLFGGTFTISNGGVFGSLLSTPILNPPQSGILGMHKIEERAVVIQGKIEIKPMMYLTLSYDHRIVDGRESVGFLVKVKEGIEEPASLLIEI
ncbi:MAG: 2-oxoglutarate dehydrogenase complex dihydrolipoyllysine-residue succinyltransferase [Bdellovibrionales bacterium]